MIGVSGSLAYDRILNFNGHFADHIIPDKIHTLSVSFIIDRLEESFGGTAGNIAYSLALLGESPYIISTAGEDFANYKKWLSENHIATDCVMVADKEKTAFATIMTDLNDNQVTAFYPGAMTIPYRGEVPYGDIEVAVIGPGNMADMRTLSAAYREHAVPFVYDPGQQLPALSPEDLKEGVEGAAVFISNDYELALFEKKTGWNTDELLKHCGMVVTTLGADGSRVTTKGEVIEVGTAHPAVLDPTGAGDAYRAGLLTALRRGWSARTAAQLGSTVAAYAVEVKGTQGHRFTKEALAARYRENYHEEITL